MGAGAYEVHRDEFFENEAFTAALWRLTLALSTDVILGLTA